jgi:hypothetical protein
MKPSQKLETLIVHIIDENKDDWTNGNRLTVATDIDAQTIERPFIHVVASDGEEHEVLRGVFAGDVLVTLESNANDGTTSEAQVKAWAGDMYHLLGDIPTMLDDLNDDPRPVEDFHCFDLRTSQPQTQRTENTWLVSMGLRAHYMGADKAS